MNDAHLMILQESLGLDYRGRGPEYRNHYLTQPNNQAADELVSLGFMLDHGTPPWALGRRHYSVTEAGRRFVNENSPAVPQVRRGLWGRFLRLLSY